MKDILEFLAHCPKLANHPEKVNITQESTINLMSGGLSHRLYLIDDKWIYRQYRAQGYNQLELDMMNYFSSDSMSQPLSPKVIMSWPFRPARLDRYVPNLPKPDKHLFLANILDYVPTVRRLHGATVGSLPFLMAGYEADPWSKNPIFGRLRWWFGGMENVIDLRLPVKARLFVERQLRPVLADPQKLIVFRQCACHNDLHVWNFLGPNMLCDWEFAGLNYELYDWANLANECEQWFLGNRIEYRPNPLVVPLFLLLTRAKLEDFRFFQNVSHLFWAVWANDQARRNSCLPVGEQVNFDYLGYSQFRLSRIEI